MPGSARPRSRDCGAAGRETSLRIRWSLTGLRALDEQEVEHHERAQDEAGQDRHRGGATELEIREGLEIDQDGQRGRRAERAAARHQVDDLELLERPDRPQEGRKEENRHDIGQRDAPELLKPARAIDARRLVLLLRNGLKYAE